MMSGYYLASFLLSSKHIRCFIAYGHSSIAHILDVNMNFKTSITRLLDNWNFSKEGVAQGLQQTVWLML